MPARWTGTFVAVAGLLCAAASPGAGGAPFQRWDLRVGGAIEEVRAEDLNGDGLKDLLVTFWTGSPPEARRHFAIFWQAAGGRFHAQPDRQWEADTLATFFDTATLSGDGRRTILYLTGGGLWEYDPRGEVAPGPGRALLSREGLVLFGDPRRLPYLDIARDWDGDGTEEVLLPGPEGVHVLEPDTGRTLRHVGLIILPVWGQTASGDAGRREEEVWTFRASYVMPRLFSGDFEGDGRRDLFVVRGDRIAVHSRDPWGHLPERPTQVVDLGLLGPEERGRDDVSLTTHLADLNGDGVTDAAVGKQAGGGLGGFTGEVRLFMGRPGVGLDPTRYQKVAAKDAITSMAAFEDVTGDGRRDLILPSLSLGLWDFVKILTTRHVDVHLDIFALDAAGKLPSEPNYLHELQFEVNFAGAGGGLMGDLADITGDGLPELIVGTKEEELSLYRGLGGKGNRAFGREPMGIIKVNTDGLLTTLDLSGRSRKDLVITYGNAEGRRGTILLFLNRGDWP